MATENAMSDSANFSVAKARSASTNQSVTTAINHRSRGESGVTVSKRTFLMNTIVSAAALASATAIPSPSVAEVGTEREVCQLAARSPRAAAITETVDPIFAAIEAHRRAAAAYAQACEAPCRMVGCRPTASVCVDYFDPPKLVQDTLDGQGVRTMIFAPSRERKPVYVSDPDQIKNNVPPEIEDDAREAWIKGKQAELSKEQRRIDRNFARTKLGKLEAIRDAAAERVDEAADALVDTKPTTIEGVSALLTYFGESDENMFPDDYEESSFGKAIVGNVAVALRELATA
jgi:hypothetical protein